ncbi:MAG: ribonuclease P protein component [Gammaproteobacteria bacterium]|nr:ribonuclease P protein component [Gammaproteobacteria bacterium]
MAVTFTRKQRLLTAAEFGRVFAEQKLRSVDNSLTLLAAPNNVGHPRLGLAIAKKQVRRAVDRNRCKRVIRDSFRHHADQLPAIDIVVLARSELVRTDKRQLHDKLARHWLRLNKRWQQSKPNNP